MPSTTGNVSGPRSDIHPLIRTILRISLTPKEYEILHDYVFPRLSPSIRGGFPSPTRFEIITRPKYKHNEAAVRASLRVLIGSAASFKLTNSIIARIQHTTPRGRTSQPLNFRLSLALSLVLLLHRLLYRFFARLRANLRTDDAKLFRVRNPRVSQILISRYAPAVGASAAGFALGISKHSQLRATAAIYMAIRSLEFLYNVLDQKGLCVGMPWWFGSWLLMPISCAQLFHAFVFDRAAGPEWFGRTILQFSPGYIQDRPIRFPAELYWPRKEEVVDSLAVVAKMRWPAFVSPILHPSNTETFPPAQKSVPSITALAHPLIANLSCAMLHPNVPSCGTAFVHHILLSVPPLARLLTAITLAGSMLNLKSILSRPMMAVNKLSKRIISLITVFSVSMGIAWGSICLWSNLIPRSVLHTKRLYLSGALGGMSFMFLGNKRSTFLYFFRAAVDSAWKAGVKRGLWKGWRAGELWIFVASWALVGAILEARPSAVQGKGFRKALVWMKGNGFVDPVDILTKRKTRKAKREEN